MSIGINIRKIREGKNISIDSMVRDLRIFKKVYVDIEKDIKKPNDALLRKIATVFGMSSDDIINYDEKKSNFEQIQLSLKNLKYTTSSLSTNEVEKLNIGKYTFVPVKSPSVQDAIFKKPQLLTQEDIFRYGDVLNLIGVVNVLPNVNIDDRETATSQEKPASIRLLNWVESYKFNGLEKTLFYTEVNTGLKVGDRIFIINGNYDSDLLIQSNKYKSKRDGYKILFIENCKIVLDIDYTGVLPYEEDSIDDFINLYIINDESDFKYFNKQVTTMGGTFDYKFNNGQNNIVYSNNTYSPIIEGWGENGGISGQGFFVKNGTFSWIDITNDFISGTFSSNFDNNNRLKIHNGDFTYTINTEDVEFKENNIYKWDNNWVVDVKYNKPIISKSNFRDGDFKGEWNAGLYGRSDKKLNWEGLPGVWNFGTLLNTKWLSGDINSEYTLDSSYLCEFNNGVPYQKLNSINNNGWGYNYIIDSEILNTTIKNGNILDTQLGNYSTQSILENYLLSIDTDFDFEIDKAFLNNCKLITGHINESDVVNSRSINCDFNDIKSINSSFKNSLILNSKYLSEDNIKIIGYEELLMGENALYLEPSHKVYRFYINEFDYNKLKIKDTFYIKGLLLKDNSKYPLNFFDKKIKLSNWVEYVDSYNIGVDDFYKKGVEMAAFISTPGDNDWLYNAFFENPTFTTIEIQSNSIKKYSIDIVISLRDISGNLFNIGGVEIPSEIPNYGLGINRDFTYATASNYVLSTKIGDIVDISNAFIVNSDFESGLIEKTDWISGNYINYNNGINIVSYDPSTSNPGGIYNIIATASQLLITTNSDFENYEFDSSYLSIGDIVFLNNVEYVNGGLVTILPDTYRIVNKTYNQIILEEINTNIISTLSSGGVFTTTDANNRYGYIYRCKINLSKIESGIFKRSYITNSLIQNYELDTTDKMFNNISNIRKLIISDSIFKNTGNQLSKATYLSTSFVTGSDLFNNGVIFRSIWNSMTFSNGLFKESTWLTGVFENGSFYSNQSFNATPDIDYPEFYSNRIKSYYKSGTSSNDRYSWRDGKFNNGEFYKSDWENGYFNNGQFYYSNFYGGEINGGVLGSSKIDTESTIIYNSTINYTVVENAKLYSSDTSFSGTNETNLLWYDGKFNGGLFSSNFTQSGTHSAIWYDGEFNGGEFMSMAKWKYGSFNNGKFTSAYGYTMSDSLSQSDYSWENGKFNNGIFGTENTGTNSTWYTGEFNYGKFVGRVWNDGIFVYGDFIGSATYSPLGGSQSSNASLFRESFTQSYYGLWRNGLVSNEKYRFIDEQFFTEIKRANYRIPERVAYMNSILWVSGTFSHNFGEIDNSVWLDGTFERGKFSNSSFNPYVRHSGSSLEFTLNDSCRWLNGYLENSDFYISTWEQGTFNKGDAYGMVWEDGICEYMNAFNILWKDGLWRNGNWYGSYFDYSGTITDTFTWVILARIALAKNELTSNSIDLHLWNTFDDISYTYSVIGSEDSGTVSSIPIYDPLIGIII